MQILSRCEYDFVDWKDFGLIRKAVSCYSFEPRGEKLHSANVIREFSKLSDKWRCFPWL